MLPLSCDRSLRRAIRRAILSVRALFQQSKQDFGRKWNLALLIIRNQAWFGIFDRASGLDDAAKCRNRHRIHGESRGAVCDFANGNRLTTLFPESATELENIFNAWLQHRQRQDASIYTGVEAGLKGLDKMR